jgi:hypothetical protein
MTKIASTKQELKEKSKKHWYQKQKRIQLMIFLLLLFFLFLSCFGQFAILENSFGERLDLGIDKIFGIETKALLGLLVTAVLPLTNIIDESEMLGKKIKISFMNLKFSPIWIILPLDTLLTFQAVLGVNNQLKADIFIPVVAFSIATIFSISAFYLSKAIVAAGRKLMLARKNLQILNLYDIDPEPLYEDADHIKLRENCDAASKEAEEAKKELEQIIAAKENLESQKVQDQEQLKQLKSQEAEKTQKIQELEQKVNYYKDHADAISQLKTKFSKFKKPMIDLMEKAQQFASVYELSKDLDFPKLEIPPDQNGKVVEKPTYYWMRQKSDNSWEDLRLQSELSPIGYSFLNAMLQKDLPPPNVRNYAPRNGLSKCLVFNFEDYGVIVYCRDEEYRKDGSKWDAQAEINFKGKLADDQSDGYCTLEFTAQEIMQNQLAVLERIKDTIELKQNSIGV